jgi:hypothetical protein
MQEAMLACINIIVPKFKISAAKLATPKSVDMVLQNGQLCSWQARQTTGISPPDCQSHDMGHIDPLLQQQAWMAGTRNAQPSDGNGHNLLYPKGQDTKSKG